MACSKGLTANVITEAGDPQRIPGRPTQCYTDNTQTDIHFHNNQRGIHEVFQITTRDPNAADPEKTPIRNFLRVEPGAAGNSPALIADGADADIDLRILPKGAGTVSIPSMVLPDPLTVGTVETTTELKTDTINESTPTAGVTVDGLLIQDGAIPTSAIPDPLVLGTVQANTNVLTPTVAGIGAGDVTVKGNVTYLTPTLKTTVVSAADVTSLLLGGQGFFTSTMTSAGIRSVAGTTAFTALNNFAVGDPAAVIAPAEPLYLELRGGVSRPANPAANRGRIFQIGNNLYQRDGRPKEWRLNTEQQAGLMYRDPAVFPQTTTIGGVGTPVKLNVSSLAFFTPTDWTHNPPQRWTYNGTETVRLLIDISISGSLTTGSNDNVEYMVYKNGAVWSVAFNAQRKFGTAGDVGSISLHAMDDACASADYYEVWVSNLSSTSNINTANFSFRVTTFTENA